MLTAAVTTPDSNPAYIVTWHVFTSDGDADLAAELAICTRGGFIVHTVIAIQETGHYKIVAYKTELALSSKKKS